MGLVRVPLRESAPVTFDGTGAATVGIGPLTAREVWYPQNVHVSANSPNTNESSCTIFVGPNTTQNYFRDQTPEGSTGDATGACSADKVRCGEKVWAVWAGGDAGAQAVLTVTGYKDV